MLKKRSDIQSKKIVSQNGTIQVFEYGKIDEGLDLAVALIKGEYPGGGKWAKNTKVETMTYYVISGEGVFEFENGEKLDLKSKDCIFIKKGQGYRIKSHEGKKLEVLMASNPCWDAEQYLIY